MEKSSTKNEIIKLAKKRCDETTFSSFHEEQFYNFIQKLINEGWSRNDLYILIKSVQIEEYENLSETVLDFLYDVETSVTGDCHIDCIFRFPKEPVEEKRFLEYVRGRKWMKQARVGCANDRKRIN